MTLNYKYLQIALLLFAVESIGQVGIGTTIPTAALDVTSTNSGVLVPRVVLTSINAYAPVLNPQTGLAPITGTLIWNTATAGVFPNNVIPGFYYWNGLIWISVTGAAANSWSLTGNGGTNGGNTTTPGTNYIGTVDAQNLDIRTNNAFVGRFSSAGEFFLGTLNTAFTGDQMNSVSKAAFPFAINGYTSFNGTAVYGLRQGAAPGPWGSVQGETEITLAANNSAVAGLAGATTHRGVVGQIPALGTGWGGLFLNDLGYTGGLFNASDRRIKKNIQPFNKALQTISSIPVYSYNFKTELYDNLGDNSLHYGVMADELKAIMPSLVKTKSITAAKVRSISDDKQMKSPEFDIEMVNYVELIPITIQGIKEQQKIIESLSDRIAGLEKIITEMQKK
jgi:hypothetical protein